LDHGAGGPLERRGRFRSVFREAASDHVQRCGHVDDPERARSDVVVERAFGDAKRGEPIFEAGGTEDSTEELLRALVAEHRLEFESFGKQGTRLDRAALVDDLQRSQHMQRRRHPVRHAPPTRPPRRPAAIAQRFGCETST
jgi:hypothetical protein